MAYASPAGLRVNSIVLAFTLIAGKLVFLRLFTRLFLLRRAGFEDLFIGLAMLFSIALTVTTAEQVMKGLGKHHDWVNDQDVILYMKAFWGSIWTYYVALFATKLSILIQYFKLFPMRRFRIVCSVMLTIVISFGLWSFLGSIFLCFPVEFFWDKTVTNGVCLSQHVVWFTNGALNIAQDVAILVLPFPVFRSLNISKNQKRGLMFVFGFGGIVCLVSAARLYSLVAISDSDDPTFDNTLSAALTVIEVNVGIICTCLPALRPLLAAMMPRYFRDPRQHSNSRVNIMEQPKYMRTSASSRAHTPGHSSRPSQSRTGSSRNSTRPYTPGQTSWKSHSRSGSALSNKDTELDVFQSRTTTVTSSTGTRGHRHVRQNSTSSQQQRVHPLRMAPFSPPGPPRLARLPEDLAVIGQLEPAVKPHRPGRGLFSPLSPLSPRSARRQSRSGRAPVFHKPLPVTPFPIATVP